MIIQAAKLHGKMSSEIAWQQSTHVGAMTCCPPSVAENEVPRPKSVPCTVILVLPAAGPVSGEMLVITGALL